MKKILLSFMISILLLSSGCSTLITRGEWGYFSCGKPTSLYPSTVRDGLFIYGIFTTPLEDDWYIDAPCRPIILVGSIIDFIPSIITDTLIFPWDLSDYMNTRRF